MFGFSWEACIGLIVALFVLLVACPAGPKKTADQIISAQTYYGGAFLSLIVILLNVIIYIWVADKDITAQPTARLLAIWSAITSSIFGAFYWTALCLYTIKKVRSRTGLAILIGWPLTLLLLNYLKDIYDIAVYGIPLLALRDNTTDAIAMGMCFFALFGISYAYYVNKHRWKDF